MNEVIKKLNENQSKIVSKVLEMENGTQDTRRLLLELQGKFLAQETQIKELEKKVRGLKACLKDEELACYELGTADKGFEDKVAKQLEQPDLKI
jgi:peptidoglycan hydrolase CwlO-like protein